MLRIRLRHRRRTAYMIGRPDGKGACLIWNKMAPELMVSDFAKSLDFYVNILGFQLMYQRENPSFAYLDLDGVQVMIEETHATAWKTAELEYPYGRGINLQMEVADATRIATALESRGFKLFRPMKESWYEVAGGSKEGQKEFLVQDPDGYLLRFAQPLGSWRKP